MRWERHGRISYPMHRTAYKTPIGMSPYQLVYGKTCHLPIELEFKAHWVIMRWNMDLDVAGYHRMMQLSELEKWGEKAYHNSKVYKDKVKRWHDKRIKRSYYLEIRYYFLIPG